MWNLSNLKILAAYQKPTNIQQKNSKEQTTNEKEKNPKTTKQEKQEKNW